MNVIHIPSSGPFGKSHDQLVEIYRRSIELSTSPDPIRFDFAQCSQLDHHGVAFVVGLARYLKIEFTCEVDIIESSMSQELRTSLDNDGFFAELFRDGYHGANHAIPVRVDGRRSETDFLNYLRNQWLGRGWMRLSEQLGDAMAEAALEIYINAFEHSLSPVGMITCGRFIPESDEVALTFVDFGIGIPGTVRAVAPSSMRDDAALIEWALEIGNSSKPGYLRPGPRGKGLDLLRKVICANDGSIDIVSNAGHVSITRAGCTTFVRDRHLPGTVISVRLNIDESRYDLQRGITPEDVF